MHSTINEYIKSYDQYQKMDQFKKVTDQLHPIPVVSPWYHVGIYLVKTPVSKSGNNYLQTVMDYFTKWSHVVPIPDKSARTVASDLFNICKIMGFPAIYISDQRREFVNDVISCLTEKRKAAHIISTTYHPQTNELLSDFNKIVKSMTLKICSDHNW